VTHPTNELSLEDMTDWQMWAGRQTGRQYRPAERCQQTTQNMTS
jgi:hypothetical protein